jgi:broad specificity phosphatase PhoE
LELVCVRHGQTAWNAVRRFQGWTDVPLDEHGRAQARDLAAHLADERFDIAVASDLSRAAATAAAIGAACRITVEPEPRLREMHFGDWEGLTWDEIVARAPELAERPPTAPAYYAPAGGESFDAVIARVRLVLRDLTARLGAKGRALVVSHAGVMHALLRVALDEPAESSLGVAFLPASIMRLRGDGRIPWRLERVNEMARPQADPATAAQ